MMRRWLLAVLLLAAAVGWRAADCTMGWGMVWCKVLGPESPKNLWQFAEIRGWTVTSGTDTKATRHHAHLLYHAGYFYFDESSCDLWGLTIPDGTVACFSAIEYTENPGEAGQRAFVAAFSCSPTQAALSVPDATMREVPPVTLSRANDGDVLIEWTALPLQDEIVSVQVLRHADGVPTWDVVATLDPDEEKVEDTPSPEGVYWYALRFTYIGDVATRYSPHGLAASIDYHLE